MLQHLPLRGPGQAGGDPRRGQVALLPQVDAYHAHVAGARVARGVGHCRSMIGVDEPLDLGLILPAPCRRTILDRTGLQQDDEDEE